MKRTLLCVTIVGLLTACSGDPTGEDENVAPEVVITSPAVGATFAGGDTLAVTLAGSDAEDGALAGTSLSWWVVLHHAVHTHPYTPPATGTAGELGIARAGHVDADIFLRVYARAVDAEGVADTAFVDIAPRLTTLGIVTEPAGLQVTLDGQPRTTPLNLPVVQGMERAVGAVDPQTRAKVNYGFRDWSDGGTSTHTVTIPVTPLVLTVAFDSIGSANVAPAIAITTPAAGATVTEGTAVSIAVNTVDSDGTVQRVDFYVDGAPIGQVTTAPFTFAWTPAGLGARALTARAVDDNGASSFSAAVTVTVQGAGAGDVVAPVATLVTPAAGTLDLTGAVALSAAATDNVGVTQVEFSVDGVPLATDDVAPYEATLPSTAAYASGAHVVRARARDAAGNFSPWSAATVTFGGNVALPDGFTRTTVVSGLGSTPTGIAFAPDGRIFVTEQFGALRVIKNGVLLAQPFATFTVDALGERGLLGVVIDPDFATNGHLYVYYTSLEGGSHNRISRLTATGDVAVAGSEVPIVVQPSLGPVAKHNGGAMHFGTDGKLYVAVGDNGDGTNAPLLSNPFGKMLRFNRDGTIPTDNPFYAQTTGVNRAIWARGLRNPYSFAIHRTSGRMHINDVGLGTWEEVNLGRVGANYGWPITEGPTDVAAYDTPLLAYRHEASPTLFDGFAVVGGAFYTPSVALFGAEYVDDYFFGDYVMGWIYRMDAQAGYAPYAFAQLGEFVTGLAVASDGALYVLVGTRVDRIGR